MAAWVGAASQSAGLGFGELLKAGLNVAPPAVFVLGIGALAYGLWPRGAIGVAYGLVVWSFLVETISTIVDSNRWLRDTSPWCTSRRCRRQLQTGRPPSGSSGSGAVAATAGIAAFERRDLVGA